MEATEGASHGAQHTTEAAGTATDDAAQSAGTGDQFDFMVVSNRLPVDRCSDDESGCEDGWRRSPGGLVTALAPMMTKTEGAWVGWHGAPDETVKPFSHGGIDLIPVQLSTDDIELFYEGFSNATLWPLYHDVIAPPEFHRTWWDSYRKVNKRFDINVENGKVYFIADQIGTSAYNDGQTLGEPDDASFGGTRFYSRYALVPTEEALRAIKWCQVVPAAAR